MQEKASNNERVILYIDGFNLYEIISEKLTLCSPLIGAFLGCWLFGYIGLLLAYLGNICNFVVPPRMRYKLQGLCPYKIRQNLKCRDMF